MVGAHRPEGIWVVLGRVATAYYFLHFLVLLPMLGKIERPLPLPESISSPVLRRCRAGAAAARCRRVRRQADGEDRDAPRHLRAGAPALALPGPAASAAQTDRSRCRRSWRFDGPFGTFDRASEQRGLQVWQEVCSNCHSMKEAYYRNLTASACRRSR